MNRCYLSIILVCIFALIPSGCGRKKPPLPPVPLKPLEVTSIKFKGDKVVANLMCRISGARLILFGKPKRMCPLCRQDLKIKAEVPADNEGKFLLIDSLPDARCMVYRVGFEKGDVHWLGDAYIVCKEKR